MENIEKITLVFLNAFDDVAESQGESAKHKCSGKCNKLTAEQKADILNKATANPSDFKIGDTVRMNDKAKKAPWYNTSTAKITDLDPCCAHNYHTDKFGFIYGNWLEKVEPPQPTTTSHPHAAIMHLYADLADVSEHPEKYVQIYHKHRDK